MSKHSIDDLREHLFDTLKQLKDRDNPMDIDRARAVAEVAKVITDGAKVEVDFMRVSGASSESGFFPVEEQEKPRPARRLAAPAPRALPAPRPAGSPDLDPDLLAKCTTCKDPTLVRDSQGRCPRCERAAAEDEPLARSARR